MTIREIAQRTGMSTTTICKALKNPSSVREKSWLQIEKALGGDDVSKIPTQIHIIIPDLKNLFFADLLSGAVDMLTSKRRAPVVHLTYDERQKEAEVFAGLGNHAAEGIIWVPAAHGGEVALPKNLRSRIVLADRNFDHPDIYMRVTLDNYILAQHAVEYLRAFNLGRLYFLNGPRDSYTAGERARGALAADPSIEVHHTDFVDEKRAYHAALELLGGPASCGFLLGNQTIAYGFLKAFRDSGLDVLPPCITFDHLPMQEILGTPISYIALPAYKIGQAAASMLLESNPRRLQKQSCILQGSLHFYNSPSRHL